MDRNFSLAQEVRAILRSPAFMRSPSLSKVLDYLLSRELSANDPPTQYDIAVEAMGKGKDFNEVIDSAVRVQMSRLRKALSDYYLLHAPQDGLYVHIRAGEYRLRTARLEVAYPHLAAAKQSQVAPVVAQPDSLPAPPSVVGEKMVAESIAEPSRGISAGLAEEQFGRAKAFLPKFGLPILGILALAIISWVTATTINPKHSSEGGLGVPYVASTLDFSELQGPDRQHAYVEARLSSEVRTLLQKSLISRYNSGEIGRKSEYNLLVDLNQSSNGLYGAEVVLTDDKNRVVTERSLQTEYSASELLDALQDEITSVISPAGHITRDLAKKLKDEPRNDFECFLAVETSRARGSIANEVIDRCIEDYKDGEFTPYIRVRRAFTLAQAATMSGQILSPSHSSWVEVSSVLEQHPDNAYANALAAKFLIASSKCAEAAGFAREGFSRGRTYPALELAVIVDAYGCDEVSSLREFWAERIARITVANRDPHPLLEAYILLGVILSDQEGLLDGDPEALFSLEPQGELGPLLRALRAGSKGEATQSDMQAIYEGLPSLIFSPDTRSEIIMELREKNQQNGRRLGRT